MSRGVDILLGEILEAIDLLRRYIDGVDYEKFRVDLEMAWEMVQQDLPLLEVEVRRMLLEIG